MGRIFLDIHYSHVQETRHKNQYGGSWRNKLPEISSKQYIILDDKNDLILNRHYLLFVMCRDCVKEVLPDRGSMCLENGSYLWNFERCIQCGNKEPIIIANRTEQEDEEEEELVTYKHLCTICEHVIAEHTYTFRVDDEHQEYSMTCLLCGKGSDHKRIDIEGSIPNGVC